ncbi:aliphatic sulfonate ABC transporter permease protein [Caenibius tardaugens NBRC 16725]|uniref:Aliphatic sulfonate ABC transporter permease protein n=1 Tax=Caenibius tardaugens NBRC 16725 TaxID=1219035 RepID=U2YQI0_9SPHN|nr:ABC transporter permease subunit [Caenibius tardaugens]AZI37928.1 ABC transporter permease subunit [Caenibius tardaugens NBRC 16725]GAD50937.1 aliphatic sulfonate ABC transporter permease protein [Caenibius tardaugens NBRC 16725]
MNAFASLPLPEALPLVEPAVQQQRGLSGRLSLARRAIGPLSIVAAWVIATTAGWVDPSILPSPPALAEGFGQLWTEQNLPGQIALSLGRALGGGAIGAVLGLSLGVAAGLSRIGEELFDASLQMLRTVPFLALVPLFIVWFGIGEFPKLLLIALATMFPMYLNAYAGVRNVDRKVIEAMRSFGLNGYRLVGEVVLPLALPQIFTGLRFSLGVSVLVLIAAEQINASAGLGYLLNNAQTYQQVDVILICIGIYALLGLGADLIVRALERVFMPWRANIAVR